MAQEMAQETVRSEDQEQNREDYQKLVDELNQGDEVEARVIVFQEKEGYENQLRPGEAVYPGKEQIHYYDDMEGADIGERSVTSREVIVVKKKG